MYKQFFVFILLFCNTVGFAQSDSLRVFKKEIDSLNNYIVIFCNDQVVSKEIKTELFSYKANYLFGTKSYVESSLKLVDIFDTISDYLDSNLKANLSIEMPDFKFSIINKSGRIDYYDIYYDSERIRIFRDCFCGVYRGVPLNGNRVFGGRVLGYNSQFIKGKTNLYLKYRYNQIKEFDFKTNNGLPTQFITYQDSNLIDKKVKFVNGIIDTIESYYKNGGLMYKASIRGGKLNGDFVYNDSSGNEMLKVNIVDNQIHYFILNNNRFEYSNLVHRWMPIHIPTKRKIK